MKRVLKWAGIGIVGLLVLLLAGLMMFGGAMIKGAVNGFGPVVMGVPVTLQKAIFRPLTGKVRLIGLHVGNPEGFKTAALFEMGQVSIDMDPMSLFRETIVIHRIEVVAPQITYERGLLDSNFGVLQAQLEGAPDPKEKSDDTKKKKGGRKIVIDELIVTDPSLNVSVKAAGGYFIPVKLGKVELKGIGRDHGGVTFADAISIIFSVITSNVENAVLGAGHLIGEGGKLIGEGVMTVGGAVIGGASSVVEGVGGAVADGASSVVKGIGELFGGESKPAETAPGEKP